MSKSWAYKHRNWSESYVVSPTVFEMSIKEAMEKFTEQFNVVSETITDWWRNVTMAITEVVNSPWFYDVARIMRECADEEIAESDFGFATDSYIHDVDPAERTEHCWREGNFGAACNRDSDPRSETGLCPEHLGELRSRWA